VFAGLFELSPHGTDVHVGTGPRYPWGGLYGGQIVAQALRAAAFSVDDGLAPHSIRAYFIRRGDHTEPIRYEVDRIRNGRSFATRRVVARQAVGAILNAESSFQRPERAAEIQTVAMPEVPPPEVLPEDSWSERFDRVFVPPSAVDGGPQDGGGRVVAWMRVRDEITEPADPGSQLLHRCWLAYLSDDLPAESVLRAHPVSREPAAAELTFTASLDHAIWFHRRLRADEWHLYDVTCHHYVGGRGLAIGHVFAADGAHVATIAQEVLLRDGRDR
jgi:acyl-CoA thioesterase-2